MRIVIDLQGAQNSSRFRGIGRYTAALTKSILQNNANHEIIIALNGAFPDSIAPIYSMFEGLLPKENIRIWASPKSVSHCNKKNDWRRQAAEILREAFLLNLNPDVVLISSLFEGAGDDVVTSIDKFTDTPPTAVILYDLIPFLNQADYLANTVLQQWYDEKLTYLSKTDMCLAISESSRQEAINHLQFPAERIVNISAACDEVFYKRTIPVDVRNTLHERWHITRPFVFYSGASDPRKNHIRLIDAYANLPINIRNTHQLIIAGMMPPDHIETFKKHAQAVGLAANEMLIIGHIDDETMVNLYNLCQCFIFPSWHEGFGLPALEAMACGAVVIGSNASSVPEVIGNPEALFDPLDTTAITAKLEQALTDQAYRQRLIVHGETHCKTFSWHATANKAIAALEQLHEEHKGSVTQSETTQSALIKSIIAAIAALPIKPLNSKALSDLALAIHNNFPDADSQQDILNKLRKSVKFSMLSNAFDSISGYIKRW
ncbi:MAG: glycosyltransferase family 1 protein [Sulfuriferula sp.]